MRQVPDFDSGTIERQLLASTVKFSVKHSRSERFRLRSDYLTNLPSRSDNLSDPSVDGFGDLAAGMTEELAGVSQVSFACSLGADVSKLKFLYSGD